MIIFIKRGLRRLEQQLQYYRKLKITHKRGSMSLLMALVLSALLIVFSIQQQIALYRSDQAALAHAMSAQIQTGLANYEIELLDDYGLWGFRTDRLDEQVFHASLPDYLNHLPLTIVPAKPLEDPSVLSSQITSYMQARLPVVYMENLLSQLDVFAGINQLDDQGRTIGQVSSWLSGISQKDSKVARQGLLDGLFAQIEDDIAVEMDRIYRETASDWAGFDQGEGLSGMFSEMPDFFDPASLAQTVNEIDQFFNFDAPVFYEKACLAEYILGQFGRAVHIKKSDGQSKPIYSLSGLNMLNFPEDRSFEVERILTGLSGEKPAKLIVQSILVSMRTVIQLTSLLIDEKAMQTIRGSAVAISSALAALSVGAIVVDPETITWLIAVARSVQKGWSDVKKLLQGSSVTLWPGNQMPEINMFYSDYLRVLLLALPQSTLLRRTIAQIEYQLPGPYFTSIEVHTTWFDQPLALNGGYPFNP